MLPESLRTGSQASIKKIQRRREVRPEGGEGVQEPAKERIKREARVGKDRDRDYKQRRGQSVGQQGGDEGGGGPPLLRRSHPSKSRGLRTPRPFTCCALSVPARGSARMIRPQMAGGSSYTCCYQRQLPTLFLLPQPGALFTDTSPNTSRQRLLEARHVQVPRRVLAAVDRDVALRHA